MSINCHICGEPLTNGLDTYGLPGEEVCATCWFYEVDPVQPETIYGLAPHHHDLNITGSIIGSTVFEPLPKARHCDYGYWIENRKAYFLPCEPGMGMWTYIAREIERESVKP